MKRKLNLRLTQYFCKNISFDLFLEHATPSFNNFKLEQIETYHIPYMFKCYKLKDKLEQNIKKNKNHCLR